MLRLLFDRPTLSFFLPPLFFSFGFRGTGDNYRVSVEGCFPQNANGALFPTFPSLSFFSLFLLSKWACLIVVNSEKEE